MAALLRHYRPELHYMRGPGPKWHEIHGGLAAPACDRERELPFSSWFIPATAALIALVVVIVGA
jgi:hypothetical protein